MKAVLGGLVALALLGQASQPPQFRGGTRLILVETHVVAKKDGKPIEGLTAAQFAVFIDGKPRVIESVEFVRTAGAAGDAPGGSPGPATGSVPAVTTSAARPGRIIMLVVDEASFPLSAQVSAREAATRVVNSVSPDDYLGLVAIPGGIEIGPTRNHMEIRNAISRITGQRVDAISPQFNISASEASALKSRDSSAREIIRRECAKDPRNVQCPKEVEAEGFHIADLLEAQALLSITGLRSVLDGVERLPGRKTVLLVSAGIPMSSKPGGRPNLKIETEDLGRRAARANVSLFVLYMNVHFLRSFSAQFGRRNSAIFDDITMFSQGLEHVSDSGGGVFFTVQVQSDPFVARAMRESSASYVLAVQATPADQDGKEHSIRVTAKARDSEIRFRRFVTIPKESSKF